MLLAPTEQGVVQTLDERLAQEHDSLLSLTPVTDDRSVFAMTFLSDRPDAAITALQQSGDFIYVEPDTPVHAFFTPNDPTYSSQWHLQKIGVPGAWDLDTAVPLYGGDPTVVVAVIDTGIAYETFNDAGTQYNKAPDFANTAFTSGFDFVNNDSHPNDDNGHGTHVAATIAESTNNGSAAAGIAFNSTLMPLKVLDRSGDGLTSNVVSAIDYAVAHEANIINLSLGSTTQSQSLQDAVNRAINAGVLVVAATGNENQPTLAYPAAYAGVLAVTALNKSDTRASYANYGTNLDLAAPGGDGSDYILQQTFSNLDGQLLPNDYTTFGIVGYQGTSQAAPQVSAAAALLMAQGANSATVTSLLSTTATDLGSAGYDTTYGFGRVNVQAAMAALINDTTPPVTSPAVSPSSPNGLSSWYTVTPTITLTASDGTGIGIRTIFYQWDSGTPSVYTAPVTAPEGSHAFTYYATDNAGNEETHTSIHVAVDTVSPTLTLTSPSSTSTKTTVSIAGQFYDGTSGMASQTFNNVTLPLDSQQAFSIAQTFTTGFHQLEFHATDVAGNTATVVRTVFITLKASLVVGAAAGGGPQVLRMNEQGKIVANFFAYSATFRGGVRVTSGDANGDGKEELFTAVASGGGPMVRTFTQSGKLLSQFFAFDSKFLGGVRIATGDVNGDGTSEIVAAPGAGIVARIRVFNRQTKLISDFLPYSPTFRGGVNVATGDFDGDGVDEIVTAPASLGGPQVKIFKKNGTLIGQFLAYDKTFRGGVNVATGDIDGNGSIDIVAASGEGQRGTTRIFSSKGTLLKQFSVFPAAFHGGVTAATSITN